MSPLLPMLSLWLCSAMLVAGQGRELAPASRFGFTGPEIFPIDQQISHLNVADLDGDGLQDLVVVNNLRSKINLLFNRTGKKPGAEPARIQGKRELNELPPGARFRIDSIASEKRIASLTVVDLNGDRRPDIAYYGEPKELIVLLNAGGGEWSPPRRIPVDDAQVTPNALVHGDLNGDARQDLILLAETHLWVLFQKPDQTLTDPVKIPFTASVKAAQVLDIDGDGRDDLLLVNWDSTHPFRFRLQNASGQLGPEQHFAFPPTRSFWADDLDGDRRMELMTIALHSGRAQVSNFQKKPAEPLAGSLRQGALQILPLTRTDKPRRGVLWADVNRDGRTDLLIAEPDTGQLSVHLQETDGTLGPARRFPTLTGVTDLAVADWDGDGQPEIFFLSADERQISVSRFEPGGRLPFPTPVPLDGRPLAMALARFQKDSPPTLAVILDQEGKRSLWLRTADGKARQQKLAESFKSNPSAFFAHDVDQDGHVDLIALTPYEKIKILRSQPGQDFAEIDVTPPGGTSEQPWFSLADVDGDGKSELLLSQKNFLRAVLLGEETAAGPDTKRTWTLRVKDQINGAASNSRLVGAVSLKGDEKSAPTLLVLDAERKTLAACERDAAGVWQVIRSVPLPFTEFSTLGTLALGGARPNSVSFTGPNAAAWMSFSGPVWEIKELDGYETPIKDARLTDVVSGDLNQDGRKDLVFLETGKNHLDLVTFDPPHQLVPVNRWQVFEERTFRNRRTDGPEPREAQIADVTGDGKNDLIVVVHDRILVYPQE